MTKCVRKFLPVPGKVFQLTTPQKRCEADLLEPIKLRRVAK